MKLPDEFKIPPGEYPDTDQILERARSADEALLTQAGTTGASTVVHAVPHHVVKAMAEVATEVWKAKGKILDPITGEVRDEMKRLYRHIDKALESLREVGLETRDYTGETFDYGLPLKVVTTQPIPNIQREKVIETLRPTILWNKQMIQMGEVVIAVPTSIEAKP